MFSTTELIKDLYELEVTCNITIEELADDIMEDMKKSYNQALDDLKTKIDDEYYDGGYGDYHEVEMIVRMIEELSK